MDEIVNKIYEKIYEKGEKLSLKDKIKAKVYVTKLIAINSRLFMKARSIQKRTIKSLCDKCNIQIETRNKDMTIKEHYKLLDNHYFCDKCTPKIREYTDFMTNIKIKDVKL